MNQHAFTTQTKTITALQELEMRIAELDGNAFRNGDMQNMLLNKLNAVIANIEAGKNKNVANQFRNDILTYRNFNAVVGAYCNTPLRW